MQILLTIKSKFQQAKRLFSKLFAVRMISCNNNSNMYPSYASSSQSSHSINSNFKMNFLRIRLGELEIDLNAHD